MPPESPSKSPAPKGGDQKAAEEAKAAEVKKAEDAKAAEEAKQAEEAAEAKKAEEAAAAQAQEEEEGDSDRNSYTVQVTITNSRVLLGVASHVAVGALHGLDADDELSVADAKGLVKEFLEKSTQPELEPDADEETGE